MMNSQESDVGGGSDGARPGKAIYIPHIVVDLFLTSPDMIQSAREAIADRRMASASAHIHEGDIEAAIAAYARRPSPDLIVLQLSNGDFDALALIDNLSEVCAEKTRVIVLGYQNDVSLYRRMIGRGVSEYAVAPINALDLIELIAGIYVDSERERLGRTIACFGATGGAGSSTIARNLAYSIAEETKQHVVLIDFDLMFGSCDLAFGLDRSTGMADALSAGDRIDQALLDKMLVKSSERVSVLSASDYSDMSAIRSAQAAAIVEFASKLAPSIVIDLPHCWTESTRDILFLADEIVLVSPPNLPGLRNTTLTLRKLESARPNDHKPFIVLNQVGVSSKGDIAASIFEEKCGAKIAAQIRYDAPLFSACANEGRLIVQQHPASAASRTFTDLADAITGIQHPKRSRWLNFFSL